GVQLHLDLPPSLADGPGLRGLEQLRRQAAPGRLLYQHLDGGPSAILRGGLDEDEVALALDRGVRALEVEAGRDLSAGLVEGVGQLRPLELGDDVERELRH